MQYTGIALPETRGALNLEGASESYSQDGNRSNNVE